MRSYFRPLRSATRPFVTTSYVDGGDKLVPVVPDRCICAEPGVGCRIVFDHWRDRKTGPRFPLAVMRCVVHEVAFTLYPLGHVPYGTAAVAPVGPAGELKSGSEGTMFEAADDAARGTAWARETPRDDEGRLLTPPKCWWSTQLHQVDRAAHVVGVADRLGDRPRERIAEALGVDLLDVAEARAHHDGGYVACGRAVRHVLDRIAPPPLKRILVAGHLAGCWGPPMWWDEQTASLVDLVGPRRPPPSGSPTRSTTSGHRPEADLPGTLGGREGASAGADRGVGRGVVPVPGGLGGAGADRPGPEPGGRGRRGRRHAVPDPGGGPAGGDPQDHLPMAGGVAGRRDRGPRAAPPRSHGGVTRTVGPVRQVPRQGEAGGPEGELPGDHPSGAAARHPRAGRARRSVDGLARGLPAGREHPAAEAASRRRHSIIRVPAPDADDPVRREVLPRRQDEGEARGLFFLDDASRFGLHVVVGTAESAVLFLRGLYEMVRRYGLFDTAYLDRGPGFIANDTAAVVQQLGALLVLGVAGYPPGRGKIEKFNQTALAGVLRTLDGHPDVDPRCGALELRIGHWLREIYNHT